MPRHVVLLRGVNLGSRNRVAMPKLRDALEDAGFDDVQTYLQSGNVVLSSGLTPAKVATKSKRMSGISRAWNSMPEGPARTPRPCPLR